MSSVQKKRKKKMSKHKHRKHLAKTRHQRKKK
ncbi:MAG: AURKAIP1/COX24 domain-containing protein [Desulfobacteraceae bacterium]|nr:AURKAIP1/COX24 domain-containing protein [Desulfobacteraceae bacterium]MCD4742952.1 AURKAIP1/COX24 domain-containing protein [Desulfobacteraceae bacterium]MCK5099887.1 AURKAIP1/COX24 domain-containing protein [Desulfobacteraceae bacterium]MCP3900193.1 AURKAIP1/COX24 domain-containing protein [Desulfobacteraceae bacterium]